MKKIVFILCALVFTACDSGSDNNGPGFPGEGLPELTTSQKNQMKIFVVHTNDMEGVTGTLQQKRRASASARELSPSAQLINEKIEKAFRDDVCEQTTSSNYGNRVQSSAPTSNEKWLKVNQKGAGACPIVYSYNIKISLEGDETSSVGTFSSVVDFQTSPAKAQHDIQDSLEIQSYKNTANGSMRSSRDGETAMSQSFELTNTVALGTTTYGNIKNTVSLSGNISLTFKDEKIEKMEGSRRFVLNHSFPDFQAVGVIDISGSMKPGDDSEEVLTFVYYVNGRKVEKEEFELVFGIKDVDNLPMPNFTN